MACSPLARQAGVRLGMPLSSAQGLLPQALAQPHTPRLLAQRLNKITTQLLPYTPCLVQANAYTLLLEVSASLRLFGGIHSLRSKIGQTLRQAGLSYRLATSCVAQAAWLLATHPGSHIRHALAPHTLARRLDKLLCLHLPAAQPYLDWLEGIGCRHLGMLRQLSRAELQRRTSPNLLQALDCVYGKTPDTSLAWFIPPDHFHQQLELPVPGVRSETLSIAAQRLLHDLCAWLEQTKRAATRISLILKHDARRYATTRTTLTLQSSQPLWQAEDWLRLLNAQLAHLPLPAPVLSLHLQTQILQARPTTSAALLPSAKGAGSAGFHETLDLLAARLGHEAILQAAPRQDHRPEIANNWIPLQANRTSKPALASCRFVESQTPRPAWLLETPTPLASQGSRPFHNGPLMLKQGPERIEDGWWSAPIRRDYYVAQSSQGACYWVFYTDQGDKPGWFLHGLFG